MSVCKQCGGEIEYAGNPDYCYKCIMSAEIVDPPRCQSIESNYADQIAQLTKEREQLAAQLKELQGHIRCIYCNEKYTVDQSGELADHILSCEKSPVVQALKEMDSRIIDRMDMVSDEFQRILAITDNREIVGICERAQRVIEQKEPVIKQRNDALDKLRLSEAQVIQLLDENNSLKLDYSHSESEKAQLAAKCAAYKHIIELAWEDRRDDSDVEYVGKLAEARCNDQCGEGWLSPEKKKVLVESLRDCIVIFGFMNPETTDGKVCWDCRERAKQALEAFKI